MIENEHLKPYTHISQHLTTNKEHHLSNYNCLKQFKNEHSVSKESKDEVESCTLKTLFNWANITSLQTKFSPTSQHIGPSLLTISFQDLREKKKLCKMKMVAKSLRKLKWDDHATNGTIRYENGNGKLAQGASSPNNLFFLVSSTMNPSSSNMNQVPFMFPPISAIF